MERPATDEARNCDSSSDSRAGPEVDVVGAERDPGELGVGVGVLKGDAAAGQHAAEPRAAARPSAAMVSASGQDAGSSSPSSPRTSGVVSRSGCVA